MIYLAQFVITIPAVISMAQGWEDIERYARTKEPWLRRFLDLKNGIPHHEAYRRVISRIAPEEIERRFMVPTPVKTGGGLKRN
jgi:hypothetical protein